MYNIFKKNQATTDKIFAKHGLTLKTIIKNSYHPKPELGPYIRDDELSNRNQQVYYDEKNRNLLMSVAGTRNWDDVKTDFRLLGSGIKDTKRYQQADKTLKQAKEKYGTSASVFGSSLGGAIASRIGGADDEVFTYNAAELGGKKRDNVTAIRHNGDVISVAGAGTSYGFGNPISILSPTSWLANHSSDRL